LTEKQYKGRLARIEKWLDAVTDKDLMKGAAIVLASGLFAGGSAYVAASSMDALLGSMAGTVKIISMISAVVMALLGWVVSSVIYHGVSHLAGGKGDRNRMFALTGYTYTPALVQQILRFVNYWFLGQTAATSVGGVLEVLVSTFNVFALIGLVLVALAIKTNYGITGRKAALIALIPTAITLAFALATLNMYSEVDTSMFTG
jgi:hypothetical protein